ncbi:MAG: Holliday junction branch migration protein RuvA [Deltaproteobacteria bacterium]|nr:Holliday junction branch migration protein RuvA [Deltaproteobacteria bacterium]MBW2447429.1 Holliday junction branch migration protein RuvA [Deltaproteobacteria bacterium]
MIARLEGTLVEKHPTRVVLDVGGVGYEIFIPVTTFYELPEVGKTVALRIHTHVREDALQLFGFRSARERAIFELLIRTNGVGPKLAQSILSGIEAERLVEAIRGGQVAVLKSVPGLGVKKAERLIMELRDRVDQLDAEEGAPAGVPVALPPGDERGEEAISALVNLGYPRNQAESAVEKARGSAGDEAPLESLIREALRGLSR